ncbi:hypothetical protein HJC23_012155 [Cyclotella cryptica]|uniref:Uncharacterized protein n=1 Tax=Cyclotella cryptica TaxID=29204 RepID=A0ABD3PJ79_9STRA
MNIRVIPTILLLTNILSTSSSAANDGDADASKPPGFKVDFYNAVSQEIDIVTITEQNGRQRYEGVYYHAAPKSTVTVEVYEGEVLLAVVATTDELVSKFKVEKDAKRYVIQWGTGEEL